MPELRKDPIIGRWVIISTERAKRPKDFVTSRLRRGGFCPFCPGNEYATPPEILAYREPGSLKDGKGWRLRVVSNKFPALMIEGGLDKRGHGIYDSMNGVGAHEVIIETPDHLDALHTLPVEAVRDVLSSYRERILDLRKDKRFRYILVFKNHGEPAGASLEHSHSQLIALPILPRQVAEELTGAREYFSYKDRCVYCDIIRQERSARGGRKRIVWENEQFIAFAPFAPRFPFETWILPLIHQASFHKAETDSLASLAQALSTVLKKQAKALDDPPFNYLIHTSPFQEEDAIHYHWHIEIIPILTKVAGFEWGAGFFINPTPPEESAECLRGTEV